MTESTKTKEPNTKEVKHIKDLLGMKFFIPGYQRGYRCEKQQVNDLLDSIEKLIGSQFFIEGFPRKEYCLQQLVVSMVQNLIFEKSKARIEDKNYVIKIDDCEKIGDDNFDINEPLEVSDAKLIFLESKAKIMHNCYLIPQEDCTPKIENVYEVKDGQKRLTTIYIILKYIQHIQGQQEQLYEISYQTQEESQSFLQKIYEEAPEEDNIDFHHMKQCYDTVKEWFEEKGKNEKRLDDFKEKLLENVYFSWNRVEPEERKSKDLKSIKDLLGMNFFIPSYQRGYRWGIQQVTDLLDDIYESSGEYCIQPLVVSMAQNLIFEKTKAREEGNNYVIKIDDCENIMDDNCGINGQFEVPDTKLVFLDSKAKKQQDCYVIPKDPEDCTNQIKYEVIDGQQRLTTIYIILKFIHQHILEPQEQLYEISYATRADSKKFLNAINEKQQKIDEEEDNIDYFHMKQCYDTVEKWFNGKRVDEIRDFKEKLLEHVHFIWFLDKNPKPVETFSRLNIGKIPLTNAELLKAMLLKESNFSPENTHEKEAFRLTQLEMATQWDEIEFTLQNPEFWGFIYSEKWNRPTRIDLIFELLMDMKIMPEPDQNKIGKDGYKTFRYFYEYLKNEPNKSKAITTIWKYIRTIFQIFREWYDDLKFYHYIGFIIHEKLNIIHEKLPMEKEEVKDCKITSKLGQLIWLYNKLKETKEDFKSKETKEEFMGYLISIIKQLFINSQGNPTHIANLSSDYDVPKAPHKQKCEPILLLFNIQTIINQNRGYTKEYKQKAFYKFPFHLYEEEGCWDIEHIDPATENELNDYKDQEEWLQYMYLALETKIKEHDNKLDTIIKATIQGQVLKILVEEGDDIKKDQDIIIIKATNGEQTIKAAGDGKIGKIHVKQGDTVEKDQDVAILKDDKTENKKIVKMIIDFVNSHAENKDSKYDFDTLRYQLFELAKQGQKVLEDNEKNQIWNFAILDSSTNRSYGNSIFPSKRRIIIGRDQGKKISIKWNLSKDRQATEITLTIEEEDKKIVFIPPCTRNVFMKYYTPNSTDIMSWTKEDAKKYRAQIYETLKDFGVIEATR